MVTAANLDDECLDDWCGQKIENTTGAPRMTKIQRLQTFSKMRLEYNANLTGSLVILSSWQSSVGKCIFKKFNE